MRWTKAKLLTSNFFRILVPKNYSNRFIFNRVIQEIIGWRFLKYGVEVQYDLVSVESAIKIAFKVPLNSNQPTCTGIEMV